MPESHEKRQRARRKQQKREDKLAMRLHRSAQKRNGRTLSSSLAYYMLCRGEDEHLVDSDLWLGMLNLASLHGWAPHGATAKDVPRVEDYVRPPGLRVSADEAEGLARSLEVELQKLSNDMVETPPDVEFGEEFTELLVSMRLEGKAVNEEDILSTRDILSGQVKKDARRLVAFMQAGGFWVEQG